MIDTIKTLAEAWGPSGYEHEIRQVIRDMAAPLADEVTVDALGNVICRVGSGGKKVMVAAHMDQIGVMALYREPTSGFVRFQNLGGLIYTTLAGSRVIFEDGTIGTIGVHDQWGKARTQAPGLDGFYLDVSDGTDAPFEVGRPAQFYGPVIQRGTRVIGRGMDDRIGCFIALEAMRHLNKQTPNEVYFTFTVQEESGMGGARTAAHRIAPDVAIALDVTVAGDVPHGVKATPKLGDGAAIKVKDAGLVVPAHIRDWMVNTAEAQNIAYQMDLIPFGTTDAHAIHTSLSGVPSGAISVACRYAHTNSETVDLNDVTASIDLLTALLQSDGPTA